MKITSFNPLIVTPEPEKLIKLFEDLGFEQRHHIKDADSSDINICDVRMTDANGFHVDVASTASTKQDLTLIRMNVDDFDEAFNFLLGKGFTNPSGRVIENKYSKSAMVRSPSGFAFDLCQHIKDHD